MYTGVTVKNIFSVKPVNLNRKSFHSSVYNEVATF